MWSDTPILWKVTIESIITLTKLVFCCTCVCMSNEYDFIVISRYVCMHVSKFCLLDKLWSWCRAFQASSNTQNDWGDNTFQTVSFLWKMQFLVWLDTHRQEFWHLYIKIVIGYDASIRQAFGISMLTSYCLFEDIFLLYWKPLVATQACKIIDQ